MTIQCVPSSSGSSCQAPSTNACSVLVQERDEARSCAPAQWPLREGAARACGLKLAARASRCGASPPESSCRAAFRDRAACGQACSFAAPSSVGSSAGTAAMTRPIRSSRLARRPASASSTPGGICVFSSVVQRAVVLRLPAPRAGHRIWRRNRIAAESRSVADARGYISGIGTPKRS